MSHIWLDAAVLCYILWNERGLCSSNDHGSETHKPFTCVNVAPGPRKPLEWKCYEDCNQYYNWHFVSLQFSIHEPLWNNYHDKLWSFISVPKLNIKCFSYFKERPAFVLKHCANFKALSLAQDTTKTRKGSSAIYRTFNASNKPAKWLYNFHSFYIKCNVVIIISLSLKKNIVNIALLYCVPLK